MNLSKPVWEQGMDCQKSSDQQLQKIEQEGNKKYPFGKIGSIYTYRNCQPYSDEVKEILNRYEKREGTNFRLQADPNEGDLRIRCEGSSKQFRQQDKEDCEENTSNRMNQEEDKMICQFKLTFWRQISEQKRSDIQLYSGCEFGLKQQTNQSTSFKESVFELFELHTSHSDKCIGKDISFVVSRNSSFLAKIQNDICKLIQSNYHIDKKPFDYLLQLKKHYGYDFLYLGLDEKKKFEFKRYRKEFKKDFDNLVSRVKPQMNQIFHVESRIENGKSFKRIKPTFAMPNQDIFDSSEQNEADFDNQLDLYKPSKEKLKMNRASLYETRPRKHIKKDQANDQVQKQQI